MTEATTSALIVGAFALASQGLSRLWSRVEHNKSIEINKRIEADVNSARTVLVTANDKLTQEVKELSMTVAKLEAENRAKDLMAATLLDPAKKIVISPEVVEVVPQDTK